jgi:hypothetical protein
MKTYLTWILFFMAGVGGALAQSVSAELVLEQGYYVAGEDLVVKVRITNFSGRSLKLGAESDWLSFSVQGGPSKVVSQRAVVPVQGEFMLDSSNVGIRRVNLTPCFDILRPGHYAVSVSVRIPELNARVESKPKEFNIVGGTVLWQQDFGVPPDSKDPNAEPEIRKYSLLQVTQKKDLKLYCRLADRTGARVYRVFPIGILVSFSRPEGQLDRFSNLHVLYQTGARDFIYTEINPDGSVLAHETHQITDSRPTLRPEKDGRITVTGGMRKYASTDLPPPFESTKAADDSPVKP